MYTSRRLKECGGEKAWASNPRLENGVLYLVSIEATQAPGVLSALASSNACVTLDWAVVCSQQWSGTAGGAGAPL